MKPSDVEDGSPISSVYFDTLPDLPSYHSRLHRIDKATAIRMRWYGDRDPMDAKQQLFIERKIHRAAITNEWSTKERAPLMQADALKFISNHEDCNLPDMQIDESDRVFLGDVRRQICEKEQVGS